jgi:hypothetical protein
MVLEGNRDNPPRAMSQAPRPTNIDAHIARWITIHPRPEPPAVLRLESAADYDSIAHLNLIIEPEYPELHLHNLTVRLEHKQRLNEWNDPTWLPEEYVRASPQEYTDVRLYVAGHLLDSSPRDMMHVWKGLASLAPPYPEPAWPVQLHGVQYTEHPWEVKGVTVTGEEVPLTVERALYPALESGPN